MVYPEKSRKSSMAPRYSTCAISSTGIQLLPMAETVQLFITCLIDTLYPKIGEAVVDLLRRQGVNVEFPAGQTCCGQPAFNAGLRQQARPVAQHTIRVFEKTRGPVVIPSGSCAGMIRYGYPEL